MNSQKLAGSSDCERLFRPNTFCPAPVSCQQRRRNHHDSRSCARDRCVPRYRRTADRSINAVAGTAPPGPCPAGVSGSRPRQVELLKPPPRSDNLILVRTVTATEASRSFAALLDEVEQGQTVIVTRGGRRIATIGPTTNGNGADVRALLQSSQLDEGFAADVSAARESVDSETPAWPGD